MLIRLMATGPSLDDWLRSAVGFVTAAHGESCADHGHHLARLDAFPQKSPWSIRSPGLAG